MFFILQKYHLISIVLDFAIPNENKKSHFESVDPFFLYFYFFC